MHHLSRALGAIALSIAAMAQAHATTMAQELDVAWFKDGQQIAFARHALYSDVSGPTPYAYLSGTQVGYATCTGSGQNIKLKSESVLVGRSLSIKPVSLDGNKARLSASAMDTTLDGKHQTGPADCRSEVIDLHGLAETDIPVDISVGQTVDVHFKDAHYHLVLKLQSEPL
jgi:hypothetical protein